MAQEETNRRRERAITKQVQSVRAPSRFCFPPFQFDPAAGLLYRGDEETLLPPKVACVLKVLLESGGQLVGKDDLIDTVWPDAHVADGSLAYTISVLRQILGDDARDPIYVQTLHGRGYRFLGTVERDAAKGRATGEAAANDDGRPTAGVAADSVGQPVAAGQKLGRYEILEVVGHGATGTVYRARDGALGREVAIKVFPRDVAVDPRRVARLEREAKVLALLSHPNIAGIYGLERVDDVRFPVLELVEGQTLEQRLRAGPLGADEALPIAREIAIALEAAHEKSIVHRDLKPANIKLTPDGEVKVLDFGLAAGLEVSVFGDDPAASPTDSLAIRGARGSIVGSVAYMSPEQARGHEIDARADIWSFGCVLYELLAGSRAFRGETIADALAAIIDGEPDWTALPASTPPLVSALLRRCLRKEPAHRLRDIGDARIDIEEALEAEARDWKETSGERRGRLYRRSAAAMFVIVALAWLAAGASIRERVSVESAPARAGPSAVRFLFEPPDGMRVADHQPFAVAPDGRQILFVAIDGNGRRQLYRRWLHETVSHPIPGTEGVVNRPFFSPSGDRIAFFTETKLLTLPLAGGTPRTVADNVWGNHTGMSGSWGEDDIIVFGHPVDGLHAVPADGRKPPWAITTVDPGSERGHSLPRHVLGTRTLLYTTRRGGGTHAVEMLDLDNPTSRWPVIEDGRNAHVVDATTLVFQRGGDLYAIPFDVDSGSTRGQAELVVEDTWLGAGRVGAAPFAASAGTLVWMGRDQTDDRRSIVSWHPRSGQRELSGSDRRYTSVRLSPDGARLLLTEAADPEEGRIWISSAERFGPTPVPAKGTPTAAIWHPDGGVTYASREKRRFRFAFYHAPADGLHDTTLHRELYATPRGVMPIAWDPDGRYLIFNESRPDAFWNIRLYDVEKNETDGATGRLGMSEWGGDLSPDGRWIAYRSRLRPSVERVYVQPFREGSAPQSIGEFNADLPRWAAVDGQLFLYFVRGGTIARMRAETGTPILRFEEPEEVLSATAYRTSFFGLPQLSVAADGTLFLLLRHAASRRTVSVHVGPLGVSE